MTIQAASSLHHQCNNVLLNNKFSVRLTYVRHLICHFSHEQINLQLNNFKWPSNTTTVKLTSDRFPTPFPAPVISFGLTLFSLETHFSQSAFSTKYDASYSFKKVYSNLMLKSPTANAVNVNLSPNKVRVFKRLKSALYVFPSFTK